jgi:hypothetical protein
MPEWLVYTLGFVIELILIFVFSYVIFNLPKNDLRRGIELIPEGWKIERRGFLGLRGFDAKTPEGKWLGWAYRRKSQAVDHAWTCARFEAEIKRMDERRYRRPSRFTERSSPITPPSDGSGSEPGAGSA